MKKLGERESKILSYTRWGFRQPSATALEEELISTDFPNKLILAEKTSRRFFQNKRISSSFD
jgi:hypothetical protein